MIKKTRNCSKCNKDTLKKVSSSLNIWGFEETFHCQNCDFKVTITPYGGQGVGFGMYFLGMLAIYLFFLGGISDKEWHTSDYVIFWTFAILGLWVLFTEKKMEANNPLVEENFSQIFHKGFPESSLEDSPEETEFKESTVHQHISKSSFIKGFLTPVLFVILFLAFFTAIGMINFYFFDDNLFG